MLFLSNYHSVEDLPSLVASLLDPYSNHWESSSCVHISLKRLVKTLPAKRMSVWIIYVQMLLLPGAFPAFICCITCVTSCCVGTPVDISRSSFGVCGGGGRVSSYGN